MIYYFNNIKMNKNNKLNYYKNKNKNKYNFMIKK